MALPGITPRFTIIFDFAAKTLTFQDSSLNAPSTTVGLIKITHMPSGTILNPTTFWDSPVSEWASYDIDLLNGISEVTDIPLTDDYLGAYKFEYKVADSEIAIPPIILTQRNFTLAYTAPVVVIDLSVSCSSSQLTSADNTDYNINVSGNEYSPSTLSRDHTITKPAGSGYIGTLGTTHDQVRTIGGGSTPETYLWTKIWQTNIVTGIVYDIASWDNLNATIKYTDTVKGDDSINAQCDATICALAQCYRNMLQRWLLSLTGNFAYKENNRDKIIEANALWTQLQWNERCGDDIEPTILALKELLAGENCNCTTNSDQVSVPIVPWSAILTGGGPGTDSTFTYHIETSNPLTLDGQDGDVWQNQDTCDIFLKVAGSWVPKGNVKGSPGADADGGGNIIALLNDKNEYKTGSVLDKTAISYAFPLANSFFTWDNDYITFMWDVKLAQNSNGKLLTLTYDSTDLLNYFTDDLPNNTNDRVQVFLRVVPVNPVTQHLYVSLLRGGSPGEVYGPVVIRNKATDLNTPKSVVLSGTNSVASDGDITGDCMVVKLYHTDQTFSPGTIPLSVGRGLVTQIFTATEGQTTFEVTLFTANDYYIPLINNVPQSQLVVTRSGNIFTYGPGLAAGDILMILD